MQEEIDRLTTENFRLSRAYLLLKREVILLRTEREGRGARVARIENSFYKIEADFSNLKRTYDNIKEMQNHLSYQHSYFMEKIDKLEEIVLSYGKMEDYLSEKFNKLEEKISNQEK